MPTIKAVIEDALREITALAEAEQPTAHMVQDGLTKLNALLAQWSIEGLMVPFMSRAFLAGDTTKASYSWGPGGDISTLAPVNVAAVSFRLGNLSSPLRPVENTEFMAYRWLGNVGQPRWFYYERQPEQGLLHFDCAPYGGGFDIWYEAGVQGYGGLTAEMVLPDYYERAVVTSLAIELCASYGKEPSPSLGFKAGNAKGIIERYNFTPPPDLSLDDFPTLHVGTPLPLRN